VWPTLSPCRRNDKDQHDEVKLNRGPVVVPAASHVRKDGTWKMTRITTHGGEHNTALKAGKVRAPHPLLAQYKIKSHAIPVYHRDIVTGPGSAIGLLLEVQRGSVFS